MHHIPVSVEEVVSDIQLLMCEFYMDVNIPYTRVSITWVLYLQPHIYI